MRVAAIFLGLGLAVSSCSAASAPLDVALAQAEPIPESEQQEGLTTTRFIGPGLVCGIGFAIALQPGERFTRFDRMMDFLTYRLEGTEGAAVLYEGFAPQEADALIRTSDDSASVVALHLGDGGYDKSLAGRILTKDDLPAACKAAAQS